MGSSKATTNHVWETTRPPQQTDCSPRNVVFRKWDKLTAFFCQAKKRGCSSSPLTQFNQFNSIYHFRKLRYSLIPVSELSLS